MDHAAASFDRRFMAALNRLIPDMKPEGQKLGLAVSGGPDSVALLLLALRSCPGQIAAATVDHGLRPAAREEAEFVASLCRQHGIAHEILRPAAPIRGSIQSTARRVRYELLNGWMRQNDIDWLATAHHADDQLETMIMRILRGSGVDGLSGIREKRDNIIRPLLDFQKSELISYVAGHGISPVDDPSNRDQGYDRVRVRKALEELGGFDTRLASQSARALSDAREAIEWMVERLAAEHIVTSDTGCTFSQAPYPREIQRRLLLKCLHICEPTLAPRGSQIDQTLLALKKGQTVTLGNILCEGGDIWRFQPAPARRNG